MRDGDLDYRPKACWSLDHRGALGETVLHLCYLNNSPLFTELACALLEEYPAMALDQYEGHEFYGAVRKIRFLFFLT